MKAHALLLGIIVGLSSFSCNDQGEIPEYVEITSLQPAPNEENVDKARYIIVRLNRVVHVSQAGKIRLRYVNDTTTINGPTYCGLTPEEVDELCAGPFIWKPGRTVEVTIPKRITDPKGRTMERDVVYRFSIARDTVPFQLVTSVPRQGDTISLSGFPYGVQGTFTFNDYMRLRDSVLTITSPARIHSAIEVIIEGRMTPRRTARFLMENLSPGSTYEIVVPRQIQDYEGEMLLQEYRIVFHTRP